MYDSPTALYTVVQNMVRSLLSEFTGAHTLGWLLFPYPLPASRTELLRKDLPEYTSTNPDLVASLPVFQQKITLFQ